jgi:DNA-binding IclR family transcriptional regulator
VDKTLLKGLGLLEALARSRRPRGVTDLAREIGYTKSNVHRTLQTLCAAGYVRQIAATGEYECSLKVAMLSTAVQSRLDVKRIAEPYMESIAASTQETVHLSLLDELEVFYLHKIDSPQPVRAYSEIAGRAPAHCVATGKALLAFQGEAYLDRFPETLPAPTARSVTTRTALRDELRQVRQQGYAINRGEWRETVGGLAAPIFDATRQPLAAIGISGPLDRLRPARLKAFAPEVVAAARAISEALGCPPPP